MAARSSLPMVLAGTLLFGALTFLLGLLVGVNLAPPASPPAKPAAAASQAPAVTAPAAPAPATAAPPAQGGSSAGGGAAPTPSAPAAPAKSGAAEPPAAVKPVKVKGLGYGLPPTVEPASALRGRLMTQAELPTPDAAANAPADAAKEPAKDAAKEPGPALVYSVSLGRFLVEENAGRLCARAQEKGYAPVVVVPDPPDPSGWLTVTLGPQADATAATRLATDAAAQGFETWLVTWQAP